MVSTDQSAKLRFLEQASEVLAVSSPPVSSFLRATKRDVAASQEIESTGLDNICNGCSQALLVGWSCEPVRSKESRPTRQQRVSGASTATKSVNCLSCGTLNTIQHRKRIKTIEQQPTRIEIAKPAVVPPARKEEQKPTTAPDPAPAPPSKEQTPETTQAKPAARRKARGKHASLQALVANKKPEAPKNSGFGLDFMDFMK